MKMGTILSPWRQDGAQEIAEAATLGGHGATLRI
jgi:hypothetical protein